MGCAAAKPAVDRLEEKESDRLKVIRVNVQDPSGRELGEHFGMTFTPTFILFDALGAETWRTVGMLDGEEVSSRLDRMA
ncbi:MAG: thioredoxin family protein [Anaerolineales bacterium]|jgi:thioredoxin-related protein